MRTHQRRVGAFTLLEVMIAMTIFFVAMFSVLQLLSRGLQMARALQQDTPSPGMIAAELSQLAMTNRLDDGGSYSGDFDMLAPGVYADYKWAAQTYQFASNGLYQADILVEGSRNGQPFERKMSIFLFSPRSAMPGVPGMPPAPAWFSTSTNGSSRQSWQARVLRKTRSRRSARRPTSHGSLSSSGIQRTMRRLRTLLAL